MGIPADLKSKQDLEEKLRYWGISKSNYQILECLFRQTMMRLGYEYINDWRDESLSQPQIPDEKRVDLVIHHLKTWHDKPENKGMEFGFELIHLNELVDVSFVFEQYKMAIQKINEVFLQSKSIKLPRAPGLNKFVEKVDKIVLHASDYEPQLDLGKFDYFTKYIGVSKGIFYDFLGKWSKRNHFNDFISFKIIREHWHIKNDSDLLNKSGLQSFKKAFSKDGINQKLSGNRENYDKYAQYPREFNLVTDTQQFATFLVKQESMIANSMKFGRPLLPKTA